MRRSGWPCLLAFLAGLLAGGAGVHQLDRGLIEAVLETSRTLAQTSGRQRLVLERIDRTGFQVCPQWRLAVAAAEGEVQP
jgi:hypothetical protein